MLKQWLCAVTMVLLLAGTARADIWSAAKDGDTQAVQKEIESGVDVNAKDENSEDGKPVIRASESGYFYATFQGETGATVTPESRVGYIFPGPQKTFQAQIIVYASDIANIREGQEVQLEVDAFPASEYGTITGYVRKIMDEAQYAEGAGSYFPVWIEFDATALVGKNNKVTPLRSGLSCRAKIVTDQRRVLPYVWETIR